MSASVTTSLTDVKYGRVLGTFVALGWHPVRRVLHHCVHHLWLDAGQDGWGGAVTVRSVMVGKIFLLLISICAYSIAGSGNQALTSGLNDAARGLFVLSSLLRVMLVRAPTFGLSRPGLISNVLFAIGVAAVILVLAGGTTWLSGGFWAPEGVNLRLASPIIGLVRIGVVSRVLLTTTATRSGW